MIKEKRILSYFIGWLLLGFIVCFIGLSNVFAATYYLDYSYSQKYFDNRGTTVTGVTTTWNESLQSYISDDITTAAGSYGAGLSITSPIPILENHTYTLSIYFVDKNNIALSSKNYLAFSSTLQGAANNYANGEYDNELITSNVSNNSILNFSFTSKRNGSYIFIPWTTTSTVTQSYVTTQIIMEDLGSESVSINEINASLTNQTNELNNSIQNSTNTITDEIDDMEQSIVDSNKETQDVIKDQFNTCKPGDNLLSSTTWITGYYINSNNETVESSSWKYSDYIDISDYEGNYIYKNSVTGSNPKTILYDENKNVIQVINVNNSTTYNLKQYNAKYIRVSTTLAGRPELYVEEICSNKIDETNDKLDNIEDSLTDSSPTDMSGLGNSAGWLPAGPVDSILTLPLTMLNSLVTNLTSNSCQTMHIELPFVKENLTLPCVRSLYDKIGITGTLFTSAGLIASAFILFNYLLALYKWVDDTLTMRENTMPGYFDDNWGGGA